MLAFYSRLVSSERPLNSLKVERLSKRFLCSSKDDGSKGDNEDDSLKPSLGSKFSVFREKDSKIILDFDEKQLLESTEETKPIFLYQEKKKKLFGKLSLERGVTGVYDIEDLVEVLRHEKMKDIAVIRIPAEMRYCDYMVIANANSYRHLEASCEFINKLYKRKKHEKDPFIIIEGERSNNWKVMDMRSIVLHLMLEEVRSKYDIEMLWTCGPQFDDKTQYPEYDIATDLLTKHTKFLEELSPISVEHTEKQNENASL
ncbi:uncharacterized protein B4U80_09368 [Leptotrombidium deliense]|uniref:Mitochondrial assembly of ribosomal large subunit protein 1 n=1 Tax=Leptotrombidium deliense TaxID=299467 RepID=A0A443S8M3_9ACAR|nr:uncharacterized protein B4U80_09368 [Leptotrombidium deliense]